MEDEKNEIVVTKASDIKSKLEGIDQRYNNNMFGKYIETIPVRIDQDKVLQAEKEWFEENVNKARWLEKAKLGILKADDFQSISGKQFIKKSGVKKLANAFHISVSILETEEHIIDWGSTPQNATKTVNGKVYNVLMTPAGKELIIKVKARAERRIMITDKETGKTFDVVVDTVEDIGACSSTELATKKGQAYNYHNLYTTAATRATNRAIMNCIGGSVTAEEVDADMS
jgi:hypothetical protein